MSDGGHDGDPLGDLAREVEQRRERRETDENLFETAFESVEMDEVVAVDLWDRLAVDDPGDIDEDEAAEPRVIETGAGDTGDDREFHLVSSRLCHGCPHFADPPEMACTHEGTDIVERVRDGEFRVADCPMMDADE